MTLALSIAAALWLAVVVFTWTLCRAAARN
jgi:hypothetical protein